jgi:hypothetical protein
MNKKLIGTNSEFNGGLLGFLEDIDPREKQDLDLS